MESASASDLESAAEAYRNQLEQVKRLLVAEPMNAEYLQVRKMLHSEISRAHDSMPCN